LIAFGAATDYSVRLLIDLGVTHVTICLLIIPFIVLQLRHRVRSYSDLCEKASYSVQMLIFLHHHMQAFGVRGFYLATFLLIAISFGAELAYLTIIGQSIVASAACEEI
jgi:hypothetical protein